LASVAGLALLLSSGGVGLMTPAAGQEESTGEGIGGFDAGGQAAATRQIFTPVNNIIPTEHLLEASTPYAANELTQGPSGHAVAAAWWPGDTFANACVAYPEGFPNAGDPNFEWYPGPKIPIPCYEERAESFSPPAEGQSTTDTYENMPPAVVQTKAEGTEVSAVAEYAPQGAEGYSVAAQSARTRATIVEATLVSEATSQVNDIVLGAGAIRIQGVVSTAKATSNGTTAEVSGGTTVFGATVNGVPVSIDENGVSVTETSSGPLGQALDPLAEVLTQAGISIKLSGPTKTLEGARGEIATGGLIVSLDNAPYLANLPPELKGQLPADPTGKLTLVFGQAFARADATPGFGEFSEVEDIVDDIVDDIGAEVSGDALVDDGGTAAPVSGQTSVAETSTVQPAAATTGVPAGTAVGVGLVLLAIFGSGLAAYGLHKLATGVFEPVRGTTCPLESG
jgi:hypothetical protein